MPWPLFSRRRYVPARAPGATATISIRLAAPEDAPALERLAGLYDRPGISGDALVAIVDGELQAALALDDDRELMDPYRPTAALVELLSLRARHLRDQSRRSTSVLYDKNGLTTSASWRTAGSVASACRRP